jgi:hypothetical protein
VKDIGGGFVGAHLGENTKEGCHWSVLGETRIVANWLLQTTQQRYVRTG